MALEFKTCSPENAGIKSENIVRYINELSGRGVCLHSAALFRGGKLIAEGYEKHYSADSVNRMYSVSKSFVSAAVGCLIGEGKLSLDTKVCEHFKDKYEGRQLHPYIAEATVRDLLMMATPFDCTTYSTEDEDWVYTFFNTEPSHRAGRVFNYDTSATLVLDALVERITGLDFTVYLYEKVLKYIGFERAPQCVREPGGVQWGGSGVLCTLRELAAFALLFRNAGRSPAGEQLIPEWYIKEAVTQQICNEESNNYACYKSCGYGYQVWMIPFGWAFFGMGNQLAIYSEEKEVLFVCTSDDQGNGFAREFIFELLEKYILDECEDASCEGGDALEIAPFPDFPLPYASCPCEHCLSFSGKEFSLLPNAHGFEKMTFTVYGNEGEMRFTRCGEEKLLRFGIGHYVDGVFPEIYSGSTINTPSESGYRCTAAAVWAEKDKLVLRCYLIDNYLGNFTANISFKDGGLDIRFTKTAEWFLNEYTGYLSSAD